MVILDYKDRRPIYEQVTDKLQEMMLLGVLAEGSPLPSVRSLATDLAINPNTIQRAYAELERRGCIYTVKGKGSFVADSRAMKEKRKTELLNEVSDAIDEAIRLGIPGDEIKRMVDIQYRAAQGREDDGRNAGTQNGAAQGREDDGRNSDAQNGAAQGRESDGRNSDAQDSSGQAGKEAGTHD